MWQGGEEGERITRRGRRGGRHSGEANEAAALERSELGAPRSRMVPAMMEVLAPLMLQTPSGFNSHPLTFARNPRCCAAPWPGGHQQRRPAKGGLHKLLLSGMSRILL